MREEAAERICKDIVQLASLAAVEPEKVTERIDREVLPEVIQRRTELFNKYIIPNLNLVYWLCKVYSASYETIQENYSMALTNLYRGIETYNPNEAIATWIHICTKRYILEQERRRARVADQRDYNHDVSDMTMSEFFDAENMERPSSNALDEKNYRQFLNDDILEALDSLNPIHRDALILQQAGYSLKEIAEIEYKKGRLDSRNIDTVKSRLFLARRILMKRLNRNGTKKTD